MSLSSVPTIVLTRELRRRKRALRTLTRRRRKLARRLELLYRELATIGGSSRRRRRRKGRRGGAGRRAAGAPARRIGGRRKRPLADILASVLSKTKAMPVQAVVASARRHGYRSTAKQPNSIRAMVNRALITDSRFKRADRGLYILA